MTARLLRIWRAVWSELNTSERAKLAAAEALISELNGGN